MKAKLDAIMSALEEKTGASWKCYDCEEDGGCYEITTYSPAGENVVIVLRGGNLTALADDASEAWEAFDWEEHASRILVAKRSGDAEEQRFYASAPNTLGELIKDAGVIDDMYKALYYELRDAAQKEGGAMNFTREEGIALLDILVSAYSQVMEKGYYRALTGAEFAKEIRLHYGQDATRHRVAAELAKKYVGSISLRADGYLKWEVAR